ncbi:MAG: class I SAM-dependent methyltransferase [Hyphomicrobiales bacterium]
MSDIAEPQHQVLMDRVYRYQRHIYDATRKYYLLDRDRLIAELQPPAGGRVLEVGCGTGRNLVAVARRYRDARVHGFDISLEMLESAAGAVEKAGLVGKVRLAHGDATKTDPRRTFNVGGFERIYFSYTLSMIPDWRAALDQMVDALAPGGSLHIVDFGTLSDLPGGFRAGLTRWLSWFHVEPRAGRIVVALKAIARERGYELSVQSTRASYSLLATLRRPMAN